MIGPTKSHEHGVRTKAASYWFSVRGCSLGMLVAFASFALDARGTWGASGDAAISIERGFLFLDGEFIAPPFQIQPDGEWLVLGERRIAAKDYVGQSEWAGMGPRGDAGPRGGWRFGPGGGRRFGPGDGFGRGPRMREQLTAGQQLYHQVHNLNHLSGVVILRKGESPLMLERTGAGQDLIEQLLANDGDASAVVFPASLKESGFAAATQLLSETERTPMFVAHANDWLDAMHAVQKENEQATKAALLFEKISFPLTIVAMVLVVLAFGHLLANSPTQMKQMMEPENAAHVKGVIVKSLCFIGLLSIIDLVWTLTASQAGTMRELNPLGQSFIQDPILLVLFKASVTTVSIGLLYALHRFPFAQRASWWCCLILTLLTARWLTFQSLFV